MQSKMNILEVNTPKDLALEHFKNAPLHYVIGYIKDIGSYAVSTHYLEGLYGYGGLSFVVDGKFSKYVFEDNDDDIVSDADFYTVYIFKTNEAEIALFGSEVNHFGDSEFGEIYHFDFYQKIVSSEELSAKKVRRYDRMTAHPRDEKDIIQLNARISKASPMVKLEVKLAKEVIKALDEYEEMPRYFIVNISEKLFDKIEFYQIGGFKIDIGDDVYEIISKKIKDILVPFTDESIEYFQDHMVFI